jgi:shikimate dehydrogenase
MEQASVKDIYGIFGFPLTHSLSPLMQNAAFKKLKLKAVYLPFEFSPSELKKKIAFLKKMPLAGFNVTVPYKENFFQVVRSRESGCPRSWRCKYGKTYRWKMAWF